MKKPLDFAISLLIKLHSEGVSASEIAADLNAAGYVSMQGLPFTTAIILNIIKRQARGFPGRYAVAFKRSEEACA